MLQCYILNDFPQATTEATIQIYVISQNHLSHVGNVRLPAYVA